MPRRASSSTTGWWTSARITLDERVVDLRRPARSSPSRPCSGPCRRRRSACSRGPAPAGGRVSPSQMASSDSSSPSRNSSTTTGVSPKRRSTSIASSASRASSLVRRDHHALAGGQAVGLDHRRVAVDRRQAVLDASRRPRGRRSARRPPPSPPWRTPWSPPAGRPPRSARSTGSPRPRTASTSPATSGASGPTTTRSIRRELALGHDRGVARDPGVARRGEQLRTLRGPLRARARSRARGRPPPTTRTFVTGRR